MPKHVATDVGGTVFEGDVIKPELFNKLSVFLK
jgi:hypothetical protein